jgi:hypothetical protein
MNRRIKKSMPRVGNHVVTLQETGLYYGKQGRVVAIEDYNEHRPYVVQFRNGQTRSFRQGDVWKPSQICWS